MRSLGQAGRLSQQLASLIHSQPEVFVLINACRFHFGVSKQPALIDLDTSTTTHQQQHLQLDCKSESIVTFHASLSNHGLAAIHIDGHISLSSSSIYSSVCMLSVIHKILSIFLLSDLSHRMQLSHFQFPPQYAETPLSIYIERDVREGERSEYVHNQELIEGRSQTATLLYYRSQNCQSWLQLARDHIEIMR